MPKKIFIITLTIFLFSACTINSPIVDQNNSNNNKKTTEKSNNITAKKVCDIGKQYKHNAINKVKCNCPTGYEFKTISTGWGPCPREGMSGCPESVLECIKKSNDSAPIVRDHELFCQNDDDCIIKPIPYCCGENVEFADACFHKDGIVLSDINCTAIKDCSSRLPVKDCICDNQRCTPVFEFN